MRISTRHAFALIAIAVIALLVSDVVALARTQPDEDAPQEMTAQQLAIYPDVSRAVTPRQTPPLVVLGVSGLTWRDIDDLGAYPALAKRAASGAVANQVARGEQQVACPVDGWLTLQTGRRVTDEDGRSGGTCPALSEVSGTRWRASDLQTSNDTRMGLLRSALDAFGLTSHSIGPGAGIALARAGHAATPDEAAPASDSALARAVVRSSRHAHVTVVDADIDAPRLHVASTTKAASAPALPQLSPAPTGSPARTKSLLTRLNAVVAALDPTTQVIITSLADGTDAAALQAAIVSTRDVSTGFAQSGSTRQAGLVLTADLTQQIVASAGLPAIPELPGSGITAVRNGVGASLPLSMQMGASPLAQSDLTTRQDTLADNALHARVAASTQPLIMVVLAVLTAGVVIALVVLLFGRKLAGASWRSLRRLRGVAYVMMCLPLATYLANLVPTWRLGSGAPLPAALGLLGVAVAFAAALALVAAAAGGIARAIAPQARVARWVPVGAITLASVIILSLAARTSVLPLDAAMGFSSLMGARFYGIGNSQFAVIMVATLAAIALFGTLLVQGGARLAALVVTTAGGMWVVSVDGSASLGADVGGPIALMPGVLILIILLLRGRFRKRDLVWIGALTVGLLVHFALRDYARPKGVRSHPGAFVDALVHGKAGGVIAEKASLMIGTIAGSAFAIIVFILVVLAAIALWWASRRLLSRNLSPESRAVVDVLDHVPGLRPLAIALATSCVLGVLFNDSGILVAGIVVVTAAPLLLAAVCVAGDTHVSAHHAMPWRQIRWAAAACLSLGLIGAAVLTIAAGTRTPNAAATSDNKDEDGPVVALYTHSLTWEQLRYLSSGAFGRQANQSALFNLIPLSSGSGSCPVDAFLATSASAPVWNQSLGGRDLCATQPVPAPGATIAGWDYYRRAEATGSHTRRLGSLGDALTKAHVSAHAIGGDAATALVTSTGQVAGTVEPGAVGNEAFASQVAQSAATHELTIVNAEADSVNDDPTRIDAAVSRVRDGILDKARAAGNDELTAADIPVDSVTSSFNPIRGSAGTPVGDLVAAHPEMVTHRAAPAVTGTVDEARATSDIVARQVARLEAVLAALPEDARVLVVSTTSSNMTRTMEAGFVSLPNHEGGLARTASVRRAGMIQTSDLGPTLASWVGIEPSQLTDPSGAPITEIGRGMAANDTWHAVADGAQRARLITKARSAYQSPLRTVSTAAFILALILTIRPLWRRLAPTRARSLALAGAGELACLTLAAQPLSGYLIGLIPWWRMDLPVNVVRVDTWVTSLVIAALGMLAWRRAASALVAIGGATAGLLMLDVARGAHVLVDSPNGFNSLAGARFYGAGNETYTLAATGFFFSIGIVAAWLVNRGRKTAGITLFVVGGLVVAAIDGAPSMGADFGGPISLLPGLFVTAVLLSGARLSWKKILAALVGTGLVGTGVAVADWLRPPASRTHLGRFVQSALTGDLWPIISRKLGANLSALTWSGHRWVVLAALVLAWCVLAYGLAKRRVARPTSTRRITGTIATWRWQAWSWLAPQNEDAAVPTVVPGIGAVLAGWLVTEFFAFALNDSGILLPGLAAILGVPLLLALVAHVRRTTPAADPAAASAAD
ncbi:MAG: hypothetical protein E7A79_05325 [Actinomycetaceae bacterium]|nr:hypothetical protein [Actinomycetaceae bacterium]